METTIQANTLRNVLNQPMEPILQEGEYAVQFASTSYVQHPTDATKDYLKVVTRVVNGGRQIVENKFSKGLPIMVSHIRKQLGRENERIESLSGFLQELIDDQTEVKCWVTRPTLDSGRTVTNINYLPPIEVEETEVVDDTLPL